MKGKTQSTNTQPTNSEPTHDQIAQRAYEIFLAHDAIGRRAGCRGLAVC